ncbi:DUF2510 domain-containing protein [Amycolatopsis suaedae]|uniref:DUF2510 domain-containing protein n=1 Tax=Amycolatopsis suaedae TaxID=2510978 RepID=A0A4Q7JBV6_9PSEU|nr:DUF2510 domain-containing protein [Amycolatopsis suaedae]RZQ64516.1 DUF2510 domain-containing protein [Amycolatopsis suaedae]
MTSPRRPGWYADRTQPQRQRWWDGRAWSERTRPVGGGTLFTEPVLLVGRQPRQVGTAREYGVYDQHREAVGSVVWAEQGTLKKVLRRLSHHGEHVTQRFEVRDANHSIVLRVTRQLKERLLVSRADHTPIGEIVPGRGLLVVDGSEVGAVHADGNDLSIRDSDGDEVARVTASAEHPEDSYEVRVHRHLPDPLASMVVACALTIDAALSRGGHATPA